MHLKTEINTETTSVLSC